MIVCTAHLLVTLCILTRVDFVDEGMVNLFLPAMAVSAKGLHCAPFVVISDESSYFPALAQSSAIVVKQMWLAAKILPVVSVDAVCFVMILVLEWTPLCLEVKHVELGVLLVLVNQPSFDIQLRVSKRAQAAIHAFVF